jgi:hypothetical protein
LVVLVVVVVVRGNVHVHGNILWMSWGVPPPPPPAMPP